MKRKWWIVGAAALAAALLSLCFFGVRVRLAPRWVVSRALGTVLTELDSRFEKSPVHMLTSALDREGRQKADLQMETQLEYLGIVRYDMHLNTQLRPCRVQAEGTVVTGGKALDLSLYLDGDFAAVSSKSLVEGNYYGITYDSFSQDIRSRELLAALIGDKTISQWEQSVSKLDAAMSRDVKLPEMDVEDMVSCLYGVLTLKPQVSRVETPAGAAPYAYAVTFEASVQEIVQAAENYRDQIPAEITAWLDRLKTDSEASVKVVYLLSKGDLVQIMLELDALGEYARLSLSLGVDPAISELNADLITKAGDEDCRIRMELDTVSDDESYQERLHIVQTQNHVSKEFSLDYTFDLSTGEMDLSILRDDKTAQLQLNLKGEGDTLTIHSQNVTPFLNLFVKKPLDHPAICTLELSPGGEVAVPEYRNLDQWSVEDLFALLTGLGGLLGLKLP